MFNPGIFDKGVLIPKDDKIPDPLDTNCDFLLPHTEQIDFNCYLPFFVLKTLPFYFLPFFTTYTTSSLHVCFLYLESIRMLKKVNRSG